MMANILVSTLASVLASITLTVLRTDPLESAYMTYQDRQSDAMPIPFTPTERDKLPTPPSASFGPGKAFYGPVTLANGITVRLVSLQDNSKKQNNL